MQKLLSGGACFVAIVSPCISLLQFFRLHAGLAACLLNALLGQRPGAHPQSGRRSRTPGAAIGTTSYKQHTATDLRRKDKDDRRSSPRLTAIGTLPQALNPANPLQALEDSSGSRACAASGVASTAPTAAALATSWETFGRNLGRRGAIKCSRGIHGPAFGIAVCCSQRVQDLGLGRRTGTGRLQVTSPRRFWLPGLTKALLSFSC